jgi:hypothetical protein
MRARYSPIMPKENNWAPEKIAIMEARKGNRDTPPLDKIATHNIYKDGNTGKGKRKTHQTGY